MPTPGTLVLCAYAENTWGAKSGKVDKGYFYLGAVMGNIPGLNNRIPTEEMAGPIDTKDVDPNAYAED